MALISQNTTVGTTATLIAKLPTTIGQGRAIQIFNSDTASIFVGTSTVTTSGITKGRVMAANSTYQIWVSGGDVIYAVSAAGTSTGAVIVQYSA